VGAAPNLPFWMGALQRENPGSEFLRSAVGVLGHYGTQHVTTGFVTVSDRDRRAVIAAMRAPASITPLLLPGSPRRLATWTTLDARIDSHSFGSPSAEECPPGPAATRCWRRTSSFPTWPET
jgi:hypothetical protein